MVGIDCHIGSQIAQVEPYLDALDRLLDLVEAVESEGIPIHHIDVGGGLGIQYAAEAPPSADELVRRLLQRVDARGYEQRELLFEPGRSLVGNAGVLLTEVLYLKPGAGKNFCIVDAAMNDLVRPAMYQAWMAIEPCRLREGSTPAWDVVGPVCESGDWLGRGRELAVQPGDMLAVLSAGAYAMSMASNYNSRARAAEVMLVDGRPVLIRERERIEDLMARERLIPRPSNPAQSRPSSAAWQATRAPWVSINTGRCAEQRALACGQRGWKAQPDGGFSGLGTSPCTGVRELPLMWMSGIASSSMRVYGCRGRAKSSALSANSTSRPRYMTPT